MPRDRAKTFIKEYDTVLLQGIKGKLGRSKGDLPGIALEVIKVNGISLRQLTLGKKTLIKWII